MKLFDEAPATEEVDTGFSVTAIIAKIIDFIKEILKKLNIDFPMPI